MHAALSHGDTRKLVAQRTTSSRAPSLTQGLPSPPRVLLPQASTKRPDHQVGAAGEEAQFAVSLHSAQRGQSDTKWQKQVNKRKSCGTLCLPEPERPERSTPTPGPSSPGPRRSPEPANPGRGALRRPAARPGSGWPTLPGPPALGPARRHPKTRLGSPAPIRGATPRPRPSPTPRSPPREPPGRPHLTLTAAAEGPRPAASRSGVPGGRGPPASHAPTDNG